ncbi:MAG: hypothetical protein M1147_08265 [Nitrospirae bacterium]|nr:hypothetical protein [Nitrospirota bacterium]MCL5978095.1 hypothetical protein [Nitrospirota bacterium]
MKRFLSLIMVLALLTGCATVFQEGARPVTSIKQTTVEGALKDGKIYYKPSYHKSGMLRWQYVLNEIVTPSEKMLEFEKIFIKETRRLFKEKGYELILVDKPSEKLPVYIEMRFGFLHGSALTSSVGATRWFVYINGQHVLEIYNWRINQFIGALGGVSETATAEVAEITIEDFFEYFKNN